jgi:hypothetical protein
MHMASGPRRQLVLAFTAMPRAAIGEAHSATSEGEVAGRPRNAPKGLLEVASYLLAKQFEGHCIAG